MSTVMKVKDVKAKYFNEEFQIRSKTNLDKVAEYADSMKEGAQFPPIVLGEWPEDSTYGSMSIVDGFTRFHAALKAKLDNIPVVVVKYKDVKEALIDSILKNLHGQQLTKPERNARIKELNEEYGMQQNEIAKVFHLHKGSVSKIIAGKQATGSDEETEEGGKRGTKERKTGSEPLSGKAFVRMLPRLYVTLKNKQSLAEISDVLFPVQGERGDVTYVKSDCDGLAEVTALFVEVTNGVFKDIESLLDKQKAGSTKVA